MLDKLSQLISHYDDQGYFVIRDYFTSEDIDALCKNTPNIKVYITEK